MVLAQLTVLWLGLAASAAAAAAVGSAQQAFLTPSASFFSVAPRSHHRQRRPSTRRRSRSTATVMSTMASEAPIADAAGGVENRMWKWNGYDIRYKVAGEVCVV